MNDSGVQRTEWDRSEKSCPRVRDIANKIDEVRHWNFKSWIFLKELHKERYQWSAVSILEGLKESRQSLLDALDAEKDNPTPMEGTDKWLDLADRWCQESKSREMQVKERLSEAGDSA